MSQGFSQDFEDFFVIEDVDCFKESEKAILVQYGDNEATTGWFPKSQIDNRSEVWRPGQKGILVISGWIADQKKLR